MAKSPSVLSNVEAKRVRSGGSFQPGQLAKEYLAVCREVNAATSRLGERMREASVFVLSSRFEGFPLVLLEALAAGLAVVSFDCPTGPAEIITNGTSGLLVPGGDIGALAAALDRLMADGSLRQRLARAAPQAVRPYSQRQVGRRWDELLGGGSAVADGL